jgi:ParB family transcriptional regulator, chromosome partitioning protein
VSEKRRGLGRGLGALIPTNTAPVTRPLGDRPVDVFFPESEGAEGASGEPRDGSPSTLTVLPGGRTAPVGAGHGGGYSGGLGGGTGLPPRPVGAPGGGPVGHGVPQAPSARLAPVGPPAPDGGTLPGQALPVPRAGGPGGPGHAGEAREGAAVAREGAPSEGAPEATGTAVTGTAATDDGLVPVPGATFAELPVGAIRPNPKQPRKVFDEEELAELVHSIKEIGVLQPVVVRRVADEDGEPRFELIMGERRLRATRDAGLERIPAIVRDTQDDALLRDALLENLHRSQLNPLEEAAAYQQLLDDFGCTHEELAGRIGRSRPQISNTIRLLKLPPLVQRRLAAGVLSAGHARALLGLEDQAGMERLAQRIVAEGLSVRAVEEIVALGDGPVAKPLKRRPRAGSHTSELDDLAARLGDRLDTRVAIALGRSKGRLSIDFASVDDLNRIITLLGPEVQGVFKG